MDEIFSLYTLIRGFEETSERFEISKESLGKILHPPGSFTRIFFSRVLECMQEMILASSIADASEYFSLPQNFLEVLFDPIAEFQYLENMKFMLESFNNPARANSNTLGSLNPGIHSNLPLSTSLDTDLLLLAMNRRNDYLLEKNIVFKSNPVIPKAVNPMQLIPNSAPSSFPNPDSLPTPVLVSDLFTSHVPAPYSIHAPEPVLLPAPEPVPSTSINHEVNIPPTRSIFAPILPSTGRIKKVVISNLLMHKPLSGNILEPDYSFPSNPSSS